MSLFFFGYSCSSLLCTFTIPLSYNNGKKEKGHIYRLWRCFFLPPPHIANPPLQHHLRPNKSPLRLCASWRLCEKRGKPEKPLLLVRLAGLLNGVVIHRDVTHALVVEVVGLLVDVFWLVVNLVIGSGRPGICFLSVFGIGIHNV